MEDLDKETISKLKERRHKVVKNLKSLIEQKKRILQTLEEFSAQLERVKASETEAIAVGISIDLLLREASDGEKQNVHSDIRDITEHWNDMFE